MNELNKKLLLLLFTFAIISSCKKEPNAVNEKVYVAGIVFDNSVGSYRLFSWTDGVSAILPDGICYNMNIFNHSIYIDGSDIYITGDSQEKDQPRIAKYWKNGTSYWVEDGMMNVTATSICVNEGDIYIAGTTFSNGNFIATYWKNGNRVYLCDDKHYSEATSIFVEGTDIYVAGREDVLENGIVQTLPTYWKNGKATHFSGNGTEINSIFVLGKDVYVSGNTSIIKDIYTGLIIKYGIPLYWKNGIEHRLTDGIDYANAQSIFVHNNDVYVTGTSTGKDIPNKVATYWKNDKPIYLTDGRTNAMANSIFVTDQAVYVAGETSKYNNVWIATYWKNATAFYLSDENTIGYAQSIYVK